MRRCRMNSPVLTLTGLREPSSHPRMSVRIVVLQWALACAAVRRRLFVAAFAQAFGGVKMIPTFIIMSMNPGVFDEAAMYWPFLEAFGECAAGR